MDDLYLDILEYIARFLDTKSNIMLTRVNTKLIKLCDTGHYIKICDSIKNISIIYNPTRWCTKRECDSYLAKLGYSNYRMYDLYEDIEVDNQIIGRITNHNNEANQYYYSVCAYIHKKFLISDKFNYRDLINDSFKHKFKSLWPSISTKILKLTIEETGFWNIDKTHMYIDCFTCCADYQSIKNNSVNTIKIIYYLNKYFSKDIKDLIVEKI